MLPVGSIHFLHVPAVPLSPERIAAIRSDPKAPTKVRLKVACTRCGDEFSVYAGLERAAEQEREGYAWYKDLGSVYRCTCGRNEFPLTYLRENLHGLLGQKFVWVGKDISFSRFYEQSSLKLLHDRFERLLRADPEEEDMQAFFEANPVLLHQFNAEKIYPKAPILTKFKTDFVILSKSGQLFLVELERPGKRLLTKSGSRSAQFTQACDQVLQWQHELRDHRVAILDALGLERKEVTRVTGVVIIGLEEGYEKGHLLRLKSADLGGLEFFTYDDILASLAGLVRDLGHL
jgi:hypothetical protein